MNDWPFDEREDVSVYTSPTIVAGDAWIGHVVHDASDGSWRFHPPQPTTDRPADAIVVTLRELWQLDPSIGDLADMPLGWAATRRSPAAAWEIEPLEGAERW